VGAAEIAEEQRIPTQYAQQILHRLRKGEIIESVRGPHGGFLLSRPAAEISLREILQAAEGRTFELICDADPVFEQACVMSHNCGLRGVWEELQSTINSFLDGRTLQSLIDAPTPRQSEILPGALPSNGALVPPPQRVPPGSHKKTL
jgi:Rrf2 family protein